MHIQPYSHIQHSPAVQSPHTLSCLQMASSENLIDKNHPYQHYYLPPAQPPQSNPAPQYAHPPYYHQPPPPPNPYYQHPHPHHQSYPPPLHQQQQQQPYIPPPQNYAIPSYPPPPAPPVQSSSDQKFQKHGPKDLWAAILFLVNLAAFLVAAYFGISHLRLTSPNSPAPATPNPGTVSLTSQQVGTLIAISVGTGFLFTSVYFLAMIKFAGELIHISFWFSIIVNFAMAAYLLYLRQYLIGIIWVLFAFLWAWMYWSWRSRIPFARLLLSSVTALIARFWGTVVTGFIGLVLGSAWYILWILATSGIIQNGQDNHWNSATAYLVLIFMIFTFYWTSQVIANTVHVTVSGVFATYYFLGTGTPGVGQIQVPGVPSAASAGRALTTSFGSVCFGSLIIALLQTIRTIMRMLANQAAEEGNMLIVFCIVCANCCLGMIESLIEYFNQYAFVQVAVYGKDYCSAARSTWQLIKTRGIDAVINDNLIGNVLMMGGLLVGLLAGFIGYIYAKFSPDIPDTGGYYASIVLICFFVAYAEFTILAEVINSGVITTFVCLAEDPGALYRTKPDLYEAIRQTYPQVSYAAV
ncbi:hypothetical protein SeLEV6574_g06349 [Synchytrium endobioticum]|uniref:Protein PNS1 n=1 Tax=Synchytrium endobioticum TaxID=286115 RepID=A0A507CP48_9FUNG|nr:hypothetical protein SeLEV6574_g06349 [Synchytrium endobioticum]